MHHRLHHISFTTVWITFNLPSFGTHVYRCLDHLLFTIVLITIVPAICFDHICITLRWTTLFGPQLYLPLVGSSWHLLFIVWIPIVVAIDWITLFICLPVFGSSFYLPLLESQFHCISLDDTVRVTILFATGWLTLSFIIVWTTIEFTIGCSQLYLPLLGLLIYLIGSHLFYNCLDHL